LIDTFPVIGPQDGIFSESLAKMRVHHEDPVIGLVATGTSVCVDWVNISSFGSEWICFSIMTENHDKAESATRPAGSHRAVSGPFSSRFATD